VIGHAATSWRAPSLEELAAAPVDLLVIGGGIVGAGIARDAALRGMRTILVDRHDLGWGTSSRSSRLVHGGIRYLEEGDVALVFEALRERAVLLHIAPHLVHPLPFVFPLHAGDRVAPWKLAAGLALYDALAAFRNVGRHRRLGKRALLAAEPALRSEGLRGGALYYDAQCDDARLVIATARSARLAGAALRTRTAVTALVRDGSRVVGATVRDEVTGATATLRATVVVNATGPWCDALRQLEDPAATPLLRRTKGVHVVVPRSRIGNAHAITFLSAVDGRVMFVLPWGGFTYIGTTDTDTTESPDEVAADAADVRYLLDSVNDRFPEARLVPADVVATWAALRPLVADDAGRASAVSREHVIVDGPGGMVSVAGGKLTTYRAMAAAVVDRLARRVPARDGRGWPAESGSDREPLPGGESAMLEPLRRQGLEAGLEAETVDHLLRHYGTEAAGLYNLVRKTPALGRRLHPRHPAIAVEAFHAARREMALTVDDVLVRRIHLYYETTDRGVAAAEATAAAMAAERGWDAAEIGRQAEAYRALVAGQRVGIA
jgi:glycerol-3-phosphate dehydrogenase